MRQTSALRGSKIRFFGFLLLGVISFFPVCALAQGTPGTVFVDGDYSYTVNEDGYTVTLTACPEIRADMTIPHVATDTKRTRYRVTNIADDVFQGNQTLESIEIGTNVQELGATFKGCSNLTTVTDLQYGLSIKSMGEAFSQTAITRMDIPAECTTLQGTFKDCKALTEVYWYDSYGEYYMDKKTIGDYTFDGCEALTDFRLPSDVATIGKYAFRNCGITKMSFSVNVDKVDDYAFYDCSSLEKVIIYSSYPFTLGEHVFDGAAEKLSIEFLPYPTDPEKVVERYKKKPNWAVYADKFSYKSTSGIESIMADETGWSNYIYSLEGKLVSTDGDILHLPKGVYVKAGKKVIVP